MRRVFGTDRRNNCIIFQSLSYSINSLRVDVISTLFYQKRVSRTNSSIWTQGKLREAGEDGHFSPGQWLQLNGFASENLQSFQLPETIENL